MKITLTIDSNFCKIISSPDSLKYAHTDENIFTTARWIINNFLCSIEESYAKDAPRLYEAKKAHGLLFEQIKSQLTEEQKVKFQKYLES